MEIRNFYILVKKHRLALIAIPVLAAAVTYFLIRGRSNAYQSKVQIATGIVDQSQRVLNQDGGYMPDNKIMEEFTNLIETMKLEKVVDQVSFKLFLHDLTGKQPFNPEFNKYVNLNRMQKARVLNSLNNKINSFSTLDLNIRQEKKIDSLLAKVGYDRKAIQKRTSIYRIESSDFIAMDVDAESPQLAAFIANTLTERFITYYTAYVNSGHNRSNEFFSKLVDEKRNAMNGKIAALRDFKIRYGILDVADESKDVYSQITEIETHQKQAEKDAVAYAGALRSIESRFNPKDRQYLEAASTKINGAIVNTKDRLRALNDRYVQSDFNPRYKKSIDSLQNVLSEQIDESSDKYISNPLVAKDNLVQEKLKMQNELELARYSAGTLKSQLNGLKSRLSGMVPAQAEIKSYERDIDVATKEYLDVQDRYNQVNVSSTAPIQLRQLQSAMPGQAKSSKKILIAGLSGATSFIAYMMVLLGVFYFDNNIRNWDDLERVTGIRILGHLNTVPNMLSNTKRLPEAKGKTEMQVYRDLLRSIRFEIDKDMDRNKVLAVTSLNNGEGKTLFSFSLAYAYSLTNKKVLLIDGNFSNPVISQTVQSTDFVEDFFASDALLKAHSGNGVPFKQVTGGEEMRLLEINNTTSIGETIQRLSLQTATDDYYNKKESISVLGNKGGDVSILEINNQPGIQSKMDELKAKFDIIIIEAGALNTLNKAKEWVQFSDKLLAVFENNREINQAELPAVNYLRSLNGKMLGWVLNKVDNESVRVS